MYAHALVFPANAVPLLDEEFDKVDVAAPIQDQSAPMHIVLCHDRAWEDQLDEGEEVSL